MPTQRIDKIFSSLGLLTRNECSKAARAGRITVGGETIKKSDLRIDTRAITLCLDGEVIHYAEFFYIMLNKPAGYISATDDPRERTVLELLPAQYQKAGLFPAGRLDKDTYGLLILTNDGVLSHRLLSPKHHVAKRYFVKLRDAVKASDAGAFAGELHIDKDEICKPAVLELTDVPNECYVTLTEGKYHQVKRMFDALGNLVTFLERVEFAGLPLDRSLKRGEWRMLSEEEIEILKAN